MSPRSTQGIAMFSGFGLDDPYGVRTALEARQRALLQQELFLLTTPKTVDCKQDLASVQTLHALLADNKTASSSLSSPATGDFLKLLRCTMLKVKIELEDLNEQIGQAEEVSGDAARIKVLKKTRADLNKAYGPIVQAVERGYWALHRRHCSGTSTHSVRRFQD